MPFTETDMREAHKIVTYWCRRKGIAFDDDLLQVGAIALWRLMSDPHLPHDRTARFNAVKWAVIYNLRVRVRSDKEIVLQTQDRYGNAVPIQFAAPAHDFGMAERRELLEVAKRVLRGLERRVIERLLVGRSNPEVAHDLGITSGSVKTHKWRATRKMRAFMVDEGN